MESEIAPVAGLMFRSLSAEDQRGLWTALIPACGIGLLSLAILILRYKKRDSFWIAALVTLPVMLGKLLLVWTIEPFMVLTPPFGYLLRGITAFALIPEGLVYLPLPVGQRGGVPWIRTVSLWAPVGSVALGALVGTVFAWIRRKDGKTSAVSA